MNNHLASNSYFLGNNLTIADVALYAYTHVADEGGFDLVDYSNIRRWLKDFEQTPGHIKMARENTEQA